MRLGTMGHHDFANSNLLGSEPKHENNETGVAAKTDKHRGHADAVKKESTDKTTSAHENLDSRVHTEETEGHASASETQESEPGKNKAERPEDTHESPKPEEQTPREKGSLDAQTTRKAETAVESKGREGETPSSILEKGVVYFFSRGRVGIDEPQRVEDVARSYIILRPIPHGAKLGEGLIGDAGNSRLVVLPKKVLPSRTKDRFMLFVEKAKVSFKDLKDNFLAASDYTTQTAGARHTPAATPLAEGVYAITTTGRESHLVYIIVSPGSLSDIHKDFGLRERDSFIISVKNTQYPAPPNASLPKGPEYPKE